MGCCPHCCSRQRTPYSRRPRPRRIRRAPPARTLWRPAPTRRRRPRPRRRSAHPPNGRALRRTRSRHSRRASARIQRPRAPSRQDHRLRHPRSSRSAAPRLAHHPSRKRPHHCRRPPSGISPHRPSRSPSLHRVSFSARRCASMSAWTFFLEHRIEILEATANHLTLVMIAMAFAIAIGVPLGMLIVHRPTLRNFALGLASIFQTIPSLALFGFLIPTPFLGRIGRPSPTVARVLYALPPIPRTTSVGPTGIDPAVLEAAEAMGMTQSQILWRVRLPLARAVILAGIRTATIITLGVATIAAAIGAGGLGTFIFRGVAMVSDAVILAGAIPAALLAIAADLLLGWLARRLKIS